MAARRFDRQQSVVAWEVEKVQARKVQPIGGKRAAVEAAAAEEGKEKCQLEGESRAQPSAEE